MPRKDPPKSHPSFIPHTREQPRLPYGRRANPAPIRVEKGIFEYPGRTKRFRAFVNRGGITISRGFTSLSEARAWRTKEEASIIDTGQLTTVTRLQNMTVGSVVADYIAQVLWGHDAYVTHRSVLDAFQKHYPDLCKMQVVHFTRKHAKQYIARRKLDEWRGPFGDWEPRNPVVTTIRREISVLRSAFEYLRDDYPGYINPWSGIGKIEGRQHSRTPRRLEAGELKKLLDACAGCLKLNKIYMPLAIFIAIETGMRQGEILNLRWEDINWSKEVITITKSKTDKHQDEPGRKIPLTKAVELAISQLQIVTGLTGLEYKSDPRSKVFGRWTASALMGTWQDVRRRAKLDKPLAFHDLRHEAISRFKNFLLIPEYTSIVGHTVPGLGTTNRYVHLNEEELRIIREKMNNNSELTKLIDLDNDTTNGLSMLQQIKRLAILEPLQTPPMNLKHFP